MYKDIPFNLTKNTNKDILLIEQEKSVQQSVKNIILTNKGELHYFPQFGCGIKKYLFEKLNIFTFLAIRDEIKSALGNFEPRIDNITVEISSSPDNNSLEIFLSYIILSLDTRQNQEIILGIS